MGVHGLWKLLEPSGKPVPVETLENHVLAVDVSIWLHQLLQGYRDSGGNSLPNAHLLGLFHRVSKLLFFRIKPVFVFDGGVPTLKKKTISSRHQQKDKATIASEKARQQLLKNLLKQKALSQVLGELKAVPSTSSLQAKKDLYELPPIVNEDDNSDLESVHDSYSSESEEDLKKNKKYKDLHGIDVHSTDFKALPADIRHDILTELKEKRKENSWGRIHEMPEDLGQFSNFQMNRLLKRRSVQVSLEEAEKEMGGRTFSLGDVETLLTEQGIQTSSDVGSRIASDNVTRYLYITDSTKVGKKASILNETKNDNSVPSEENKNESNNSEVTVDTIIDDEKVLVSEKESSKICSEEPLITTKQDLTDSISDEVKIEVSDSSSDEITFEEFNEEFELNRKLIAENSGLTQDQILSVIKEQNKTSNDSINKTVDVENSDFNVKDAIVKLENNKPHLDSSSSSEELDLLKIKGKSYSLPDINTENIQNNISNSYMTRVNSECEQREINNSDDIVVYCKKIDKKTGFYDDDDNNSTTFDRKEEKVVLETVSSNKISIPSTEEKDNGISDYSSNVEFIKVDQSLKNVNSKSKITSSVLQVTINTKENSVNNDEDIFADIFNDAVEEKINLGPPMSTNNENNGVELMNSSDTSVSEDEEDVVTTNNEVMPFIYESDSNSSPDKLITCEYFESSKKEDAVEKKINHENDLKDVNESRTVNFSEPTVNEKDESHVETLKATKKLSSKELNKLQTILVQQEQDLLQKQGKEERLASTVTEQMRIEAQELLQLFGVPWVMAPMEAEAQCAFLDRIGLTQGTITDDSDIWLFGARKVYKNFFNQKKFVLQFQAQDIQHYFKLSRGDLIELALLVGSDYTVGVTGVGPVTALEILAMFRPSSSNDSSVLNTLAAFKNWLQHPSNSNSPLANKLKEVRLEEGFPNKDVVEAYLHPLVDESEESFSWSLPDLDGLREFTKRKFGWSQARADELLLPVIKNLTQKTSQSKIDAFFQMKPAIPIYKDKVSQRVQKAIHRLGGESSSVLNQFESAPGTSSQRQRRSRGGSQNRKASGRGRGASLEIEPPPPPKPLPPPTGEELIPQRERDRLEAMKRKMQAIEVMKAKRNKKNQKRPSKAPIKQLANLSDSSSDDGN